MKKGLLNCFPLLYSEFINRETFEDVIKYLKDYSDKIGLEVRLVNIKRGISFVEENWYTAYGGEHKFRLLKEDSSTYLFLRLQGILPTHLPSINVQEYKYRYQITLLPTQAETDDGLIPTTVFDIPVPYSQSGHYKEGIHDIIEYFGEYLDPEVSKRLVVIFDIESWFKMLADIDTRLVRCEEYPEFYEYKVADPPVLVEPIPPLPPLPSVPSVPSV